MTRRQELQIIMEEAMLMQDKQYIKETQAEIDKLPKLKSKSK